MSKVDAVEFGNLQKEVSGQGRELAVLKEGQTRHEEQCVERMETIKETVEKSAKDIGAIKVAGAAMETKVEALKASLKWPLVGLNGGIALAVGAVSHLVTVYWGGSP